MDSAKPTAIFYPSGDGKPMAENSRQARIIMRVKGGMEYHFMNNPNVAVHGDLLWYPVENEPGICLAPDVMIIFGRDKEYRMSWKQWEENNLGPQVVFEILSPSNDAAEMERKYHFYETYGVQEYYVFDPEKGTLQGWLRQGSMFRRIPNIEKGFVSPLLDIRMEVVDQEFVLNYPNGRPFLDYEILAEKSNINELRAIAAEDQIEAETQRREEIEREILSERQQREEAERRAEKERQQRQEAENQAEKDRLQREEAERRAEKDRLQREETERRATLLAERLRQLGIDPDTLN